MRCAGYVTLPTYTTSLNLRCAPCHPSALTSFASRLLSGLSRSSPCNQHYIAASAIAGCSERDHTTSAAIPYPLLSRSTPGRLQITSYTSWSNPKPDFSNGLWFSSVWKTSWYPLLVSANASKSADTAAELYGYVSYSLGLSFFSEHFVYWPRILRLLYSERLNWTKPDS